jgi:hypothetical protein
MNTAFSMMAVAGAMMMRPALTHGRTLSYLT